MADDPVTCQRCRRQLDPERVDLDGWLVLDAREGGWMVVVCANCQTSSERRRVEELSQER